MLSLVLFACVLGCGGSELKRFARVLSTDAAHPDHIRVSQALATLESLRRTGALDRLRSGKCGEELPSQCPSEGWDNPACVESCLQDWRQLEQVKKARSELAVASRDPQILEPFARAVRELSPAPGPKKCDAPADSLLSAQRAVMRHLFELDPVSLQTIYVDATESELPCLRVTTLSGSVPVAMTAAASEFGGSHGHALFFVSAAHRDKEAEKSSRFPRAIVEWSFNCGTECGGGEAYAVELRDGLWRVVDTWHAWDS